MYPLEFCYKGNPLSKRSAFPESWNLTQDLTVWIPSSGIAGSSTRSRFFIYHHCPLTGFSILSVGCILKTRTVVLSRGCGFRVASNRHHVRHTSTRPPKADFVSTPPSINFFVSTITQPEFHQTIDNRSKEYAIKILQVCGNAQQRLSSFAQPPMTIFTYRKQNERVGS